MPYACCRYFMPPPCCYALRSVRYARGYEVRALLMIRADAGAAVVCFSQFYSCRLPLCCYFFFAIRHFSPLTLIAYHDAMPFAACRRYCCMISSPLIFSYSLRRRYGFDADFHAFSRRLLIYHHAFIHIDLRRCLHEMLITAAAIFDFSPPISPPPFSCCFRRRAFDAMPYRRDTIEYSDDSML